MKSMTSYVVAIMCGEFIVRINVISVPVITRIAAADK